MKKEMVDVNNLYGDSINELYDLMKNYTKEQLALIVMKKDEEIWDLINELDTKTYDLISYKIPPYYEEIEE
tara:strand:- start:581 stop:793 length:213 start_codon:yes stop_codon:yes gene_type:complete